MYMRKVSITYLYWGGMFECTGLRQWKLSKIVIRLTKIANFLCNVITNENVTYFNVTMNNWFVMQICESFAVLINNV